MKKKRGILFPHGDEMRLRFRKMKLTLLLTFLVFTSFANSFSQVTLSLHFEKANIHDVLESIEKKTDFIFLYKDDIFHNVKEISINCEDTKFEEVLGWICGQSNIDYEVRERQIILKEKPNSPQLPVQQQPQKKERSGTVKDSKGLPLQGVTVAVKGTTLGTITDENGRFTMQVPLDAKTLMFSYVGMKSQEIPLSAAAINISLEEENAGLDEVVVVAYGVQKKVSVTGAISSVSSTDILQSPASNIASSLTGRISGLAAVQLGGQPGADDPTIYIRGISTLNSSKPLIMVDGVERSFSRLDPNEIESITVLKDASSTAVYGVRGANGVILVTTKRGQLGKPQISFTTNFGIEKPTHLLKFIDSYTYATTYNESQLNTDPNAALRFSPEAIDAFKNNTYPIIYPNLDWVDYMLKPQSFNKQYNINIRGGDEKVKYFVSLGYRDEDGIWEKLYDYDNTFWYKQYNLRANLDINLTKTTSISFTSANKAGNINKPYNTQPDAEFFRRMYWAQPYASPGIIDGKMIVTGSQIGDQIKQGTDLDGGAGKKTILDNVLNFDIGLNQKLDFLTKGLSFRTKVSYNYNMTQTKNRTISLAKYFATPLYLVDPNATAENRMNTVLRKSGLDGLLGYSEANASGMNWYMETGFDYNRKFGNHNVTGLLMYNESKVYYPATFPDIPSGYVGIVGRGTYNFRSKYFLDLNVGYNGSENFAKAKRFGLFPAVSAGWLLSDEKFMKGIPALSHLKIRGSYGLVGNDDLGGRRFLYLPDTYNANSGGYNFGTSVPQNQITANESTLGNPLVTWEKSQKQNLGIDLKFFKNNLSFSFDQFYEYRYDILITRNTTPAFIPVTLPAVNLGIVSNRGFEFEVEWRKNKPNFGYFISFNVSRAKNKVLFKDELPPAEPYLATTGEAVSQTFGYVWDGFWSEKDVTDLSKFPADNFVPHAGDMRYKDLNKDGAINANDRKAIGYPINPEITGGLRMGFNFKNFDFLVLFNGAARTSRLLAGVMRVPFEGGFRNTMQWLVDGRWTPETAETATLPRFSLTGNSDYNYNRTADFWMRDASYIRLKNAEIGYSFSNINILRISKARLYVNGFNLLTFSKMKMTDPESQSSAQQLYPLMKMVNFGLNVTFK